MEVVRTAAFERAAKKLGASTEELDALERAIAADPDVGDVIKGLGGARKIRFAMKGKGKRGGGRAIYVVIRVRDAAYLLIAYSKGDQVEISNTQRAAILAFVESFK
ncbi:type II toxin-antitoxin system RelE/ParE family toxin [Phenylobacterium sp.]|uniref:type II toxin-antitoxin system RelE/ParE family toxin n=1 Tax=Phenylobacterium sp. TaxID=1871053 RepID=UPI002FC8B8F6